MSRHLLLKNPGLSRRREIPSDIIAVGTQLVLSLIAYPLI